MTKQTKPMTRSDSAVTVTVERITLRKGVAGQVSAIATVRHDWTTAGDTDTSTWECVGSTFGGPVVAVLSTGNQMFVREPSRFGSFAADPREWMRRYVLNESDFNMR